MTIESNGIQHANKADLGEKDASESLRFCVEREPFTFGIAPDIQTATKDQIFGKDGTALADRETYPDGTVINFPVDGKEYQMDLGDLAADGLWEYLYPRGSKFVTYRGISETDADYQKVMSEYGKLDFDNPPPCRK